MNISDCVQLIGKLCLPSTVMSLYAINRMFTRVMPRSITSVERSVKNRGSGYNRRINGILHGKCIARYGDGDMSVALEIDGRQCYRIYILRESAPVVYDDKSDSPFLGVGSPCIYSVLVGGYGVFTCRMDLNIDFKIVSLATTDTNGLLTNK